MPKKENAVLDLISGAFHPDLESAFLDRINHLKKDPLVPVAVVAPSGRMMNHLQEVCAQNQKSFINIHFHTFSSLAHSIVNQTGGLDKPLFSDSLFYDTLIKNIVKKDKPLSGWEDLAVPQGFPPQVRGTLRDLMDAGVPHQGPVLLEAVKDDFLGRNVDVGWLLELLRLYQIYMDRLDTLEVSHGSQLLKTAVQRLETPSVLKHFKEIIYYGFYDLTGLQKEFFEAVLSLAPCRLFFPYVHHHPAYPFSLKFRESVLLPLVQSETTLPSTSKDIHDIRASQTKIVNISGSRDEAWWVAGEIHRLHEQQGVPYSQIAIVARHQERLKIHLPSFLREHHIPFHSAVRETLARSPLLDVLFEKVKSKAELEFPEEGLWSDYVSRTQQVLSTPIEDLSPEGLALWEKCRQGVDTLSAFDHLKEKVSRMDFMETLRERWKDCEKDPSPPMERGVSLLYAEAARGLCFDVVFLLGVEERVFPRLIREDPFLRDDARFELFHTLGYKISQKMEAFEEEKLLFHLLIQSAKKQLVLTYRRTDETGAVVGPSSFLRAWVEFHNKDLSKDEIVVPRSTVAKVQGAEVQTLSARDVLLRTLLKGHTKQASDFSKEAMLSDCSLEDTINVHKQLQRFVEPGPHDGVIKSQTFDSLFHKGLASPSALETYGRCPFQFFARYMLKLEPVEEFPSGVELPQDKQGLLVHRFFESFFKNINWNEVEESFAKTFEAVVQKVPASEMQAHEVYWDALKESLKEALWGYVKRECEALRDSGFQPFSVEKEFKTTLPAPLQEGRWIGKTDRVDLKESQAVVVDYKTGRIPKDPLGSSLKGLKAQPTLYLLMVEEFFKKEGRPLKSLHFRYQKIGDLEQSELSYEQWESHKKELMNTLHSQLTLMKKGQFPIFPDDTSQEKYCDWCDYQTICRRNHGPTVVRSKKGAGKILAAIRSKNRSSK